MIRVPFRLLSGATAAVVVSFITGPSLAALHCEDPQVVAKYYSAIGHNAFEAIGTSWDQIMHMSDAELRSHALSYDGSIDRYECEATVTFDESNMKMWSALANLLNSLTSGTDKNSVMFRMALVQSFKDRQPAEMRQTAENIELADMLSRLQNVHSPRQVRYSVQTIDNGVLVTPENQQANQSDADYRKSSSPVRAGLFFWPDYE